MRFLIFILLSFCLFISADDLPVTNVYVVSIEQKSPSLFSFSDLKFITQYNQFGYNNQPAFNGNIVLTTMQTPTSGQSDIVSHNLITKVKSRLTATSESEYSPTPIRGKSAYSVVRVDEDGKQRLYEYSFNNNLEPKLILEDAKNIGYHEWVRGQLAIFYVGEPHSLYLYNPTTKKQQRVATDIGRCIKEVPRSGNLVFVDKRSNTEWFVKEFNTTNNTIKTLIKTIPGAEDFTILLDGTIVMAGGSRLYSYKHGRDSNWGQIADFSSYGIKNITRISGKKDRLAFVNKSE